MGFQRIKTILDDAIAAWTADNGAPPDLTSHGPTFMWTTKEQLLAAVGHGKRLIAPDCIGNGKGNQTNLVVDLRKGIPPAPRMPQGGPFVPDAQIQEVVDWIDAGCPD